MTKTDQHAAASEIAYPLQGLRVLDMANGKGEMCGRLLADFGAEVILIEPPQGLASRDLPPLLDGKSLYFETHNANKSSVILDLETASGKTAFKQLVATSDIVIETGFPGAMAKLGLSAAQLREINPEIIVVSITDFGQTGPYSQYRASNSVLAAMGGYWRVLA